MPQLCFPSNLKKATKNATLRSVSGDTDGGPPASPDGPVSFEDDEIQQRDEDRALLLSKEIDDFDSLVGFRLSTNDSGLPFVFSLFLIHMHYYVIEFHLLGLF